MAKSQILNYYIHLTDKVQVEAYQASLAAQTGPGALMYDPATGKTGILRAPSTGAAVEFAAPIQEEATTFSAPATRSPWFVPGTANFPRDVATFTRKSGGWFGLPILFGTTTRYYWVGHFVYAQPAVGVQTETGAAATTPARIPQRLMIAGLEATGTGEGLQDASYQGPASGRFPGGRGFSRRHTAGSSDVVTWSPAAQPALGVWSRNVFRVRKLPAARVSLWTAESPAQATEGLRIDLDSGGTLSFVERDTGAVISTYAAGLVASETAWHKLDVCAIFDGRDGPPTIRAIKMSVWLDGRPIADVAHSDPSGAPTGIVISSMGIGKHHGEVQTGEVDFDDWMVAKLPEDKDYNAATWSGGSGYTAGDVVQMALSDAMTYPSQMVAYKCLLTHGAPSPDPSTAPGTTWARLTASKDWMVGSRMVAVRPTGVNGENTFAGDYRLLLNREPNGVDLAGMTSSTISAILSVTTDVADVMKIPGALGIVAGLVTMYGYRGTGSGTLGYNLNAAGDVMVAATQGAVGSPAYPSSALPLYAPSGLSEPVIPATLTLRHVKAADAVLSTQYQLLAVVEVIGLFGPEDVVPTVPPVAHVFPAYPLGQHNAPYPTSPWARQDSRAIAPIIVVGGTYVGNGTCTELTFRVPVHWLWVRPVTGAGDVGFKWWPGMIASHLDFDEGPAGNAVGRAEIDPTFVPVGGEDDQAQRTRIRITGAHAQVNQNAVTYQYIAVSDPGARLLLAGAFLKDDTALGVPGTVPLADAGFLPLAGFLWTEERGTNTNNTAHYKGPGLVGANDAILIPGSLTANGVTFSLGSMLVEDGIVVSDPDNIAYALIRQNDGSGSPNIHQVFGLTSWVGDGAASRTISLAPATGLRPLFAMAVSSGGSGFWRDPSFTTTNSGNMGTGTQAATGFTAGGIDSFTVAASLNANGVVYTALVIWGSATAGNGGWSINGEFAYVEPDTPGLLEPEEIEDLGADPDDGEIVPPADLATLCDDTALSAACLAATDRIVNLALSRIGVSQVVVNACTELSAEAAAVRTVYDLTLEATLRDRPWPFATRYAAMTVSTASAPGDWTYTYLLPGDCLFARRLVTARGAALDPTPPPMRIGDGVLWTNEPNAILEYTKRPTCPGLVPDATFRSAWAWRLAHELAPVLTRMADRAAHCWEMYEVGLALADRFLRLGAPGVRPSAGAFDTGASSVVKLSVINRALVRIGAKTIANLETEQSREAVAALMVYEAELRTTLRDYPWPFATRYSSTMPLVGGPAWPTASLEAWAATTFYDVGDVVTSGGTAYYAILAGTNQAPPNATYWSTTAPAGANPDWAYAYRAPANMLFARRLVKPNAAGTARKFDPTPIPYIISSDDTGLRVFTNESAAVLEYTIRAPLALTDDYFQDAFAWRLAASLATSLAVPDPETEEQTGRAGKTDNKDPRPSESGRVRLQQLRMERARWAWGMYSHSLNIAAAASGNEEQREPDGDASWIRDRN